MKSPKEAFEFKRRFLFEHGRELVNAVELDKDEKEKKENDVLMADIMMIYGMIYQE